MQQRETSVIPTLVLLSGQRTLRRIALDRPRLTIGRRPYNDLMLDDLTVSGEHAVLHCGAGECVIHDLNSRNGTLVNGVPVVQRSLTEGDVIEVGVYRIRYVIERVAANASAESQDPEPMPVRAHVAILSGPQAGSTIALERPIVGISNGSGQLAAIALRRGGHVVTHLEGPNGPLVNGEPIGLEAHPLAHADLIELGGTIFQFHAEPSR
jgi:pSer/pThr/pTyr-binding forkhead associated (FHA) protein